MTEAEEFRILRDTSAEVKKAVNDAYENLIAKIRAGIPPREAVEQVMAAFSGEYAKILAAGLGVVMAESLTVGDVLALDVGNIKLSSRLYANQIATQSVVEGIARKHLAGFSDARALALELYEGYGFNPTEPLTIAQDNTLLPKQLRDALLPDNTVKSQLARAYARAQAGR